MLGFDVAAKIGFGNSLYMSGVIEGDEIRSRAFVLL
jgi:hypothetical protein